MFCWLSLFVPHRLQDSLEFIGQDNNTLKPDQNTGPNSLLGNIGNHGNLVPCQTFYFCAMCDHFSSSVQIMSRLPSHFFFNVIIERNCSISLCNVFVFVHFLDLLNAYLILPSWHFVWKAQLCKVLNFVAYLFYRKLKFFTFKLHHCGLPGRSLPTAFLYSYVYPKLAQDFSVGKQNRPFYETLKAF